MLSSSSIHRQSMRSECFMNTQEVNPSLRKPSTVFCTFITTFCQDLKSTLHWNLQTYTFSHAHTTWSSIMPPYLLLYVNLNRIER